MSIRPICKELQQVAIGELHERTEGINEDLQHLRNWLLTQLHLSVRNDNQWLITFLRGCKWSLQRAKEKIDCFYTTRTLIPLMYPLQNTEGKSGPRILFIDYCMMDFDTVRFTDLLKMFFIMTDILMIADDNIAISGEQLIINFQNIPASFFLQFTPEILKKMTVCWGTAYPLRIKLCLCINAPLLVEKLYNTVCKPLMSKKIQNRVHVYSSQNMEKAYTHLPKPLFPERFGGHNGSHTTLTMEWKRTVENYRGWVMEDSSYKSNEKLRPNKPKTSNEEFGMEGTFRKLNLD